MDEYDQNTNDRQIKQMAYQFWEQRGRPQGSPEEDWFGAETRLLHESQSASNWLNPSQLPFSSIKMGY